MAFNDPDITVDVTSSLGQVFKDNKKKHDAVKEIFNDELPAAWDDLVGATSSFWEAGGKISARGQELGEIYSSGGDFVNRAAALGGAAEDALVRQLEDEWNRLWKKRKVKIRTALNMTAGAFSWSFEEMLPVVAKRMNILATNFTKKLGSAVLNDPALRNAVIQLEEIQMILEIVDGVFSIYNAVKSMANTLEPLYPVIEIIVSAASIWSTGGASAAKFSSESAQLAMQELKKLVPLILYPLKEQILDAEIEVPNILFDTMDMVQPEEVPEGNWSTWLEDLGKAPYVKITRQINARPFALERLSNYVDSRELTKFLEALPAATATGRSQLRRRGLTASSSGDSKGITTPREDSFKEIPNYSSFLTFDNEGIIQISKKLIEAKDTTAEYYSNRQMHKLIVDALKQDGAVVDYRGKYYDAQATHDNPSGERGSFKKMNDRITDYHKILKVLSGEERADLTESIPVIDFYHLENTGFSNVYDITEEGLIKTDSITSISSESIINRNAIDSDKLLIDNNRSFLNYALSFYHPMTHFYNTTKDFSFESNIQTDHIAGNIENKYFKASGLLNGLFTKIHQEDGEDIESWKANEGQVEYQGSTYTYSELAEEMGIDIPLGVKYSSTHLAGRGDEVVGKPLYTSEPKPDGWGDDPWGFASYNYRELVKKFPEQVIDNHIVPLNEWEELGGRVEAVTTAYDTTWSETITRTIPIAARIIFWWVTVWQKKTETITNYFSNTVYRLKADYFIKKEDRFKPSIWTNKQNTSTDTLTLNIDSHSDDIAIDPYNFRKRTSFEDSSSRVYDVHIRGKNIEKIKCIMPAEIIRKKDSGVLLDKVLYNPFQSLLGVNHLILSANVPKGRLLIPEGRKKVVSDATKGDKYLPKKMFLMSARDLGFEASGNKSLCSFYTSNKLLVMKVSAVDVVKAPDEFETIKVIYEGVTRTFQRGSINPLYSTEPIFETEGSKTNYIYTLEPIEVNFSDSDLDLYPVKYPSSVFNVSEEKSSSLRDELTTGFKLNNFREDIKFLESAEIAVGIPNKGDASNYRNIKRLGTNYDFKVIGYLTGDEGGKYDVKPLLKEMIKGREVIRWSSPQGDPPVERPPLVLGELPALMEPLIEGAEFLKKADEMFPDIDLEAFIKTISSTDFEDLKNNLKEALENLDGATSSNLESVCSVLDKYLGNDADPWIKIGENPDDTISQEELNQLSRFVKGALEGEGNPPVRRLKGKELEGSPMSLYYKRYLFLNSRMHRTSGPLSKAAKLRLNWDALKDATSDSFNTLEAYTPYLDSVISYDTSELDYSPALEDEEGNEVKPGKFFFKEVLEKAAGSIDDKCLLICAPCPVAASCPYYDRDAMIKEFLPEADGVELWLKDNKLNLIVIEKDQEGKDFLNLRTEDRDGGFLVDIFKERQKVYTEIIQNEYAEKSIQSLRDSISEYSEDFDDNMGWITGGRYGTLYLNDEDSSKNRYLYDAIFVRDEESEFSYQHSSKRYPVTLEYDENPIEHSPVTYKGDVKIYIPTSLKMLDDVSGESDIYLVSDDSVDGEGKPITPLVYINKLKNVNFTFDLRETQSEDGVEESLGAEDSLDDPFPSDVAQQHINTIKWVSKDKDQWWMKNIEKTIEVEGGTKTITLDGRKRAMDVVDPLVDDVPPMDDVLSGKPFVNMYVNFLRKVHINFDSFEWVKGSNPTRKKIEEAKQTLPLMKKNLRLVVIKK